MSAMPIGRPRFVTKDEALAYHAVSIEEYGGADGLRDVGMLESALAMPMQGFSGEFAHAYPFEMAAAYAFHIAKNHPFVDGNKRTALMCCGAFLRINGWNLASEDIAAADAVVALVENKTDKSGLAEWLRMNCRERPSIELRDFFAAVTYARISEILGAGLLDENPQRAHTGRVITLLEAEMAIPAITEANIGGSRAQEQGEGKNADILFGQSHLLTALYRIAEDMGYEW